MSAAEIYGEIRYLILKLSIGIIGWVIVAPIAKLMPKRQDWLAVIGHDEGHFTGNAKYFYLQSAALLGPGVRVVFVTERNDVAAMLAAASHQALVYPSLPSVWFLLRARTVVVDSTAWVKRLRRFLLVGSKKIQLWHGVGYKRIEMDKWRNEAKGSVLSLPGMAALRKFLKMANGRLVRYDLVNTTSEFYKQEVFLPAFLSRHYIVAGYPRNSFGKVEEIENSLVWKNTDDSIIAKIPEWQAENRRLVLVAPTFRDSRPSPMGFDQPTLSMLDVFCKTHKIELIFKFHPLERRPTNTGSEHLHLCATDSDIYPLMPLSSALITDYSSIYMDYLLLDKPIIFFVPDLDYYRHRDRQLQFDFEQMSPGPKLTSWQNVLSALIQQWTLDTYADERARLRGMAFDELPQEKAVPALIAFMREQNWIPRDHDQLAAISGVSNVQGKPENDSSRR